MSVDVGARKIGLGLKAAYFADEGPEDGNEDEEMVEVWSEGEGVEATELEDSDGDGGVELEDLREVQSVVEDGDEPEGMDVDDDDTAAAGPTTGLKTTGFDWTGETFGADTNGAVPDSEPDTGATKKRRRNKPGVKVDMTGDLDKYGPRSASDFERQLLGQPNDSGLWI
ncbi:rRNA biogenesis protein rrp5, partial [Teratosphaeriaceae sp. CCFEE 6253]